MKMLSGKLPNTYFRLHINFDSRKLTLAEHNRDRVEDKASRAEDKIKGLQEELGLVNKTINTLTVNGDRAADMEDDIQEQIREMKKK